MKALIDKGAELGVDNVVIGMPHRGRLNILGNVVRKPLRQIFTEFGGKAPSRDGGEDQYLGARRSLLSLASDQIPLLYKAPSGDGGEDQYLGARRSLLSRLRTRLRCECGQCDCVCVL